MLAPSNDQSADPPIRISRHEFGSASDQLAIGTEAFFLDINSYCVYGYDRQVIQTADLI